MEALEAAGAVEVSEYETLSIRKEMQNGGEESITTKALSDGSNG